MSGQADIAVAGLGVMGANLALNLADNGHVVAAYNRTTSVTDAFMSGEAGELGVLPANSIEEMVGMLSRPRVVLIMVTAGKPVDAVIDSLLDHMEEGDIIIDGGNSLYSDTDRRQAVRRVPRSSLSRNWRLRRRGRGTSRTVDHAGREQKGVGARRAHAQVHRGQGP